MRKDKSQITYFECFNAAPGKLKSPELLIKARKAPAPEGFVVHKSHLETIQNSPFLIHWRNGRIEEIYVDTKEEISTTNLKKGIASLFQFQMMDSKTKETDASGFCDITYKANDPWSISKVKTDCNTADHVPFIRHPEHTLSTRVTSSRHMLFAFTRDLSILQSVTSDESHDLKVILKPDAGSSVSAKQELQLLDSKPKSTALKSNSLGDAVKEFEKANRMTVAKEALFTRRYIPDCRKEECPSLPKLVKESRDLLNHDNLGTAKSATAFVKLLAVARGATKEELTKSFKGSKNKEILTQLCDLAGAVQTREAHEVILKLINLDADDDLDSAERYLWALSTNSHPDETIIKDIFKISQKPHTNEKLSETLILTAAAMSNNLRKLPGKEKNNLSEDIKNAILSDLESCKEEPCKFKYLRAVRNLKDPTTVPTLLNHALNGKKKTSVEAMKALRSLDQVHWNADVQDAAQRIYYQAGRSFDSSSRTLALDILLEANPSREVLEELVLSLTQFERMYEVKQYLVQRLRQISDADPEFAKTVNSIMSEYKREFRNYHVAAPRGLTTAFTRRFTSGENKSGSLVNIQEVSGGLLKRGIVDVIVESDDTSHSLFTLGLFAGGLSSFVSSDKKEETNEVEEEEAATAGMELTVLGTQIRPFVFFNGQGELMGHVWSGTASERTPAYQAFIVTQDHLEYISLQNGLMMQMQLLGAVSFDLSGQIQMSLWNRNAHSLVEKNAGIYLQGRIQVDTSFVRSQVEFNLATEAKLNLQSDLNFSGGVSLCMQLSQPDSTIKHNVHKIERIPGSKHRLRKSKYKQFKVPGRTYALNQKNNEMCNLIFKDQ